MRSPLASRNCSSTDSAGRFLRPFLLVFVLFYLIAAQELTVQAQRPEAARDFYPQSLDVQLRRIAESTAAEVQPIRDLCVILLNDINAIVHHLEHHPTESCPEWYRFEQSVKTLDTIRRSWRTRVSVESPYIPSAVALEEITLALERRLYVWRALFHAGIVETSPLTTLYGKTFADIDRLKARTLAVEQHFTKNGSKRPADVQTGQTWVKYLETHSWITDLEAARQPVDPSVRFVSLASPVIPVEILTMLSDRANTTVHRLASPSLTNEQRTFLNNPTVNAWWEELQSWTADTVIPLHILRLLEQYEATGGMSDMKAFAKFIDRLSVSKTAEYRQLGDNIRRQYEMPNVRIFLSNSLLNNHLPPTVREIAAFRDIIQSQPVVGRRQTETEMLVSFIPHPSRVLTSLDVGVDLATVTRADAFATQLYNTGQTLVIARKLVELTENGFRTEPAQARILEHQMRLVRMNTGFDGMPILSNLVRGAVRNQYEARYDDASTESQQKILQQVRNQIDRETERRLRPINEQIRMTSRYLDKEFDLRVEQRESRTDENWLLTAWGIQSRGALSSNTTAPATLPGTFADMKIHESLPNMLLGKLELEGKQGTVRDFKEMLAVKFQQPALADPEENDDVELMFASHNPVVVRFVDGRAELTISIAALRLLGKTHRNIQVIVRYKPAYDSEGRLVLERDNYISLINVVNVREQFVMRAAFGKIFPANRPFPLVPKIFESDPQYDYLTTGHCRLEKGWFALALVEKPKR